MGNRVSNNSGVSNGVSNWMSSNSGIVRFSFISNISNISIIVIGMVVYMLDTTIRKVYRVGTFDNTSSIIGLSLVEGSTRVVISNSIGVRVRGGLSKVRLSITSMVSNNWGMMDNRSMVNNRGMSNSNWMSNSMGYWMSKGVGYSMGNWVSNNSLSSMKSVWRVSDSSNSSSEGLRLGSTSVFSLVWL